MNLNKVKIGFLVLSHSTVVPGEGWVLLFELIWKVPDYQQVVVLFWQRGFLESCLVIAVIKSKTQWREALHDLKTPTPSIDKDQAQLTQRVSPFCQDVCKSTKWRLKFCVTHKSGICFFWIWKMFCSVLYCKSVPVLLTSIISATCLRGISENMGWMISRPKLQERAAQVTLWPDDITLKTLHYLLIYFHVTFKTLFVLYLFLTQRCELEQRWSNWKYSAVHLVWV